MDVRISEHLPGAIRAYRKIARDRSLLDRLSEETASSLVESVQEEGIRRLLKPMLRNLALACQGDRSGDENHVVGKVLSEFQIVRVIGMGGTATVYEALQLPLLRPVAIKMFRPGSDPGFRKRISREAPVIILRHEEQQDVPGGGANALANLATLGVRVLPVAVVGDDEPGRALLAALEQMPSRAGHSAIAMRLDEALAAVAGDDPIAPTAHLDARDDALGRHGEPFGWMGRPAPLWVDLLVDG